MPQKEGLLLQGEAGNLEILIDFPDTQAPIGIAFVAHPHPLYGGTMHNKVTQTLASTFVRQNCIAVRMNFRGVHLSQGEFDHGEGETRDWAQLIDYVAARFPNLPIYYAGFSFGAYVMSRLYQTKPSSKLILVGTPCGSFPIPPVPQSTLIIHGELDETIPLQPVMDWAKDHSLSIVVVAGADHFFHHKLTIIRDWVTQCFFKNG